MVQVIMTKNKNDIDPEAGFDIDFNVDMVKYVEDGLMNSGNEILMNNAKQLAQSYYDTSLNKGMYIVNQLNDLMLKAEELFIQEASLSRWSGNMIDNSVVGVSGTTPIAVGNMIKMDVRIGVNTKAITTGNGKWRARSSIHKWKDKYTTIHEYNGYRMRPGVNYAVFLNQGTAKIPNAALWAGFVKRAEDRFNAL